MTRRELLGRTFIGVQVLLLAACGGDDEEDAEQPRDAPEAPQASVPKAAHESVKLRLASVQDQFARTVERTVEQWNEGGVPSAPADIQLEQVEGPRVTPSSDVLAFTERAQAGATTFLNEQDSAGTPPDLILFNRYFDFPWVFRSGLIQSLDRYLQQDQSEPLEEYLPSALDLVRYQGQTMSLPIALDVGIARYNPRQFTDAGIPLPDKGWTREEFVGAAQRLTRDTDDDGKADAWGFRPLYVFANWLPFVLQEMDEDVVDLDTGAVRLTDPAALRGLQIWDDLGRVHNIMPHGPTVTADQFSATSAPLDASILFWNFLPPSQSSPVQQAPLPGGAREGTPVMLNGALAIPTVASDAALSYAALRPLALTLGERLSLPPVIAGQQHIEKPNKDYLELVLPEYERQLVLNLLATARPSLLATSFYMTYQLFERMALPLTRGEIGVEQAAQQVQDWLQSYLNE